jgi:hypothetical protein
VNKKLGITQTDWFLKVVDHIEINKISFGFADRQYLFGYINKKYESETAKEIICRSLQYSELFDNGKISDYLNISLEVNDYKIFHLLKKNEIDVNDFGIGFDFKNKLYDEEKSSLSIAHPVEISLLKVRTGNECINDAKSRPIPKMLFSEFWHEGELAILFADTNLGKSILAVQIANAISKGVPTKGFKLDAQKQKVLYFDFEMSDKQFEKRYSEEYQNHFCWDDNFLRVEINPNYISHLKFETELFKAIENAILKYEAKILIIDNLTYLKTQATDTAKEALPLMKLLKELKLKHDLSILALAHTPKRNLSNPISKNDLAGSKHLANFADSIFAIGESVKDKSLRYLKQIKARATEMIYDTENVMVFEITKHINYLGFAFTEYGNEKDHLRAQSESQIAELDANILELKKADPTISNYEIAKRLSTNKMKVKRVLERNGIVTGGNS